MFISKKPVIKYYKVHIMLVVLINNTVRKDWRKKRGGVKNRFNHMTNMD